MGEKEVSEELDIIIKEANEIVIDSNDDLVRLVKISIAASGRLVQHADNLYQKTNTHDSSLQQIASLTEELHQQNVQAQSKSTLAIRFVLSFLLLAGIAAIAYIWLRIGENIRLAVIAAAVGVLLPLLINWFLKYWKS